MKLQRLVYQPLQNRIFTYIYPLIKQTLILILKVKMNLKIQL